MMIFKEVNILAKRKAEKDALKKYTNTPKKNVQEQDFSAEFAHDENPMKGFNRNSKQGRSTKHNKRPIE